MSMEILKTLLGKVNWETLVEYVKQAEKLYREGSIKDRKKFVVEAINALIDIPILPESVEEIIFSWAVDLVVKALDEMLGKDWFSSEEGGNA